MCADRLDGVILTGISWTKNIDYNDIHNIVENIEIYNNEIGFKSKEVAKKVLNVSDSIDKYCHSSEDNYMMELLADITKNGIKNKYISYDELYNLNEDELISKLKNSKDSEIMNKLNKFENVSKDEIPVTEIPEVKARDLNPLVKGIRIKG